jgi:hypothetical protein
MDEPLIIIHSLLRWAVVLLGLYTVVRALGGVIGKKPWSSSEISAYRLFVIAIDLQFLVGILLYAFFSPLVTAAMGNMADAMKTPALRFWLVEHPLPMFVALGLVHLGFAKAKRTASVASHRQVLLHYAVSLILILATTPWPFMTNGRPWLRF